LIGLFFLCLMQNKDAFDNTIYFRKNKSKKDLKK